MHEMALAESLMAIVRDIAAVHGATRVTAVELELGALAHVDAHAIRQCFDVVKHESIAADARLDIRAIPGFAWCMPCGAQVALARRGEACPRCGSYQLEVAQGSEMRVAHIEVV